MTAAALPFAPDFDHLVYVRVFEGCNLRCEHCFIPANPKRMRDEDVLAIPDKVRAFARPGATILLQWHGGEPTLMGARWMEDAIRSVEAGGPEFRWVHGIQTNLLGYSEEWAGVYRRHFGGEVGVSWDSGIRLLREGDRSSSAEFEARFWPNMERLLADGLDPYLIVTATKEFFTTWANPMRFFAMLEERGIRRAHLERITETGVARLNWGRLGLSNAEYVRHMARYARAYAQWNRGHDQRRLSLSPFDGHFRSVARLLSGQGGGHGCWSGKCDTRFHTIDADGYKVGCTALTAEIGNKRATKELSLDFADLQGERAKRRIVDCAPCEFRSICSSGCLALSMDDGSGECAGGSGLFRAVKELVTSGAGENA